MMETNPIIDELKAIAGMDWPKEQKAFYEQRASDAWVVECVPMRDVFTPEQLQCPFKRRVNVFVPNLDKCVFNWQQAVTIRVTLNVFCR